MTELDQDLTPIDYFEFIVPESEVVVKYIIDKLISFAIFENGIKKIEKNVSKHCYDVFTHKIIQQLMAFEFMAFDRDEFSQVSNKNDPDKIFFDQVFYGNNNWSSIEEPVYNIFIKVSTKVDRTASTLIKNRNCGIFVYLL